MASGGGRWLVGTLVCAWAVQAYLAHSVPRGAAGAGGLLGPATTSTGRMFVSNASLPFDPDGGIAAADALCETEGRLRDPSSSDWAAMIVDEDACTAADDPSVRVPCRRATGIPNRGDAQLDWVLFPNAVYYQMDGKTMIGRTNDAGLLQFPLDNEIGQCENQVSGMQRTWVTVFGSTCVNWMSGSPQEREAVGFSCSLSDGLLAGGTTPCDAGHHPVICVGPAAHRFTDPVCEPHGFCSTGPTCAQLDFQGTDEVTCNCTCGCEFVKESARGDRWVEEGGAAVVVDGQTMGIVGKVESGMELALANLSEAGNCVCPSNGGTPACETMYPTPSNSSIYDFVRSDQVTNDTRIAFFGDSITWLGGYMGLFAEALRQEGKNATLVNRGINGGKVIDTRNGRGDTPSFEDCLSQDKPTMISIMIGINDVWFADTPTSSNVTTFMSILQGLVETARQRGVKVALATVSVIGEKTDFTNGHDALLSQFATAARVVAQVTGVPIANVHQGYLDYEAANNLYPPGVGIPKGVLTIDGVHPCMGGFNNCPNHTHANYLLASLIAEALLQAAER